MRTTLVLLASLLLPACASAQGFVPPIIGALNDLKVLKAKTTGMCPAFGLEAEAVRIAAQAGCTFNGSEPVCSGMDAGKSAWLVGQQDYMKQLAATVDMAGQFSGKVCPWDHNQAIITAERAEIKTYTNGMAVLPPECGRLFEENAAKAVSPATGHFFNPTQMQESQNEYGQYLNGAMGSHDMCVNKFKTAASVALSGYQNSLAQAYIGIEGLSADLSKQLKPAFDSLAGACKVWAGAYTCPLTDSIIAAQTPKLLELVAVIALVHGHAGLTPEAFVKANTMTAAAAQAAYGGEYFRMGTTASTAEKFSAPIANSAAYTSADQVVGSFKAAQSGTVAAKQVSDGKKKLLNDSINGFVAAQNHSVIGAGELKTMAPDVEAAKPALYCGGTCDDAWNARVDAANKSMAGVTVRLNAAAAAFSALRGKADSINQRAAKLPADKKALVAEHVADFKAGLADDTLPQANAQYDSLNAFAAAQGV